MVYSFPIADRTNYTNSWLKTTQMYYLNSSGGQTSKVSLTGETQGVESPMLFLEASGENLFPYVLQILEAACNLWLVAPSSIFKASSIASFLSCLCFHTYDSFFWPSCFPLIRTFMITWATQLIQNYLPTSRFLTPSDLQSPFYPVGYIFIHRFWRSECGYLGGTGSGSLIHYRAAQGRRQRQGING